MPIAELEDLDIYYEIIGQGEPLVMIRGLGSNVDHWYEQVPTLSKEFQLLVFDNRGIARSSDPGGAFSTRDMAEDTAALMESAGIKSAHVLGYSMGGMVAQEMALNHPEKVRGLILVATDCGITKRIKARPEVSRLFSQMVSLGTTEAKLAAAACLYAQNTFESKTDVIERYNEVSMRFPASQDIMARQWAAVTQHDACSRMQKISSPTLTLTGSEDILIPPENAKIMADMIPGARMKAIDDGGHLFLIEQPQQFNQAVRDFLEGLSE